MIFGYYLVISTQAHVRSSIINLKPMYKVIFNKKWPETTMNKLYLSETLNFQPLKELNHQ